MEPGYLSALRIPLIAGRTSVPLIVLDERRSRSSARRRRAVSGPARRRSGVSSSSTRLARVGLRSRIGSSASWRSRISRLGARGASRGGAPVCTVCSAATALRAAGVRFSCAATAAASPATPLLVVSLDRDLPVLNAQTLESQHNGPIQAQLRISAAVAGSVAVVGLLLASIGIYGVTAYTVTRGRGNRHSRVARREPGRDRRPVVWPERLAGGVWIGSGAVAGHGGGCAALGTSEYSGPDVLLMFAVAALFVMVALIACYLPTRRATTIRAMEALRAE